MDQTAERILRRRMHGLYLSRKCGNIAELSRELLGLHCWFARNVAFSARIRGAEVAGWKRALTKTWLYRGTLHGVVYEELPLLLAPHAGDFSFAWLLGEEGTLEAADRVIRLMEDGVYSRAEMRRIFADTYDERTIQKLLSPWGGIFVYLARLGKVAFRDMGSRDFDLIDAEPTLTFDEVLPILLRRFLTAYGPATLADAVWFFGLWKEKKRMLLALNLDEYTRFSYDGEPYYDIGETPDMGEIPELTLLSGFDPLIESYAHKGRSIALPSECKNAVILKSGICLPTVAVNGHVAGLWNIKKGDPAVEFFSPQPKRIKAAAMELVEKMRRGTAGIL
jgi:hypothetical protein